MNLNKCPRCYNAWTVSEYKLTCEVCNIIYIKNICLNLYFESGLNLYFESGYDGGLPSSTGIQWQFPQKQCRYWRAGAIGFTYIPRLMPFDITEEKLQKLSLFS